MIPKDIWVAQSLEVLIHKFGTECVKNDAGVPLVWSQVEELLDDLYDHLHARSTYYYILNTKKYNFDPKELLVYL